MIANSSETIEWLNKLSVVERKMVFSVIQACGCICHSAEVTHFRACCEFTYVKIFDPESTQ